jgi:hypothetical protein
MTVDRPLGHLEKPLKIFQETLGVIRLGGVFDGCSFCLLFMEVKNFDGGQVFGLCCCVFSSRVAKLCGCRRTPDPEMIVDLTQAG